MSKISAGSGSNTPTGTTNSGAESRMVSPNTENITPSNTPNTGIVQFGSTPVIPFLSKDLTIGEIINFSIRGRTQEGLGILYLLGQLVQAKIPEYLQIGDRVQAQVAYENQQITFKILSVTAKGVLEGDNNQSPTELNQKQTFVTLALNLQKKIEDILLIISKFLPDSKQTLPDKLPNNIAYIPSLVVSAPEDNMAVQDLKIILGRVFDILPSEESLSSSSTLLPKLQSILTLSTTNTLRQISHELKSFIDTKTIAPELKFIATLLDQLKILASRLESSDFSKETLKLAFEKIIRALEQEIQRESSGVIKNTSKETYQTTLKVTASLMKEAMLQPDTANNAIRKIIDYIQARTLNPEISSQDQQNFIPPKVFAEVKSLITTLEQFTYTQELLLRLDPILQAMKQPELLLFPFLFQGFFSFGELIVDPDSKRSPNRKQKDSDENQKDEEQVPIIQYQAMLPMPHLGIVRFNTMQSSNEIVLELSFENYEKATFAQERIQDLRTELAKLGFNKLEISSHTHASTLSDPLIPPNSSPF